MKVDGFYGKGIRLVCSDAERWIFKLIFFYWPDRVEFCALTFLKIGSCVLFLWWRLKLNWVKLIHPANFSLHGTQLKITKLDYLKVIYAYTPKYRVIIKMCKIFCQSKEQRKWIEFGKKNFLIIWYLHVNKTWKSS